VLERIVRTTGVACALTAIVYAVVRRDVLSGVAVLGGGLLIGLSYWAIRGTVDALIARRSGPPRHSGEAAVAAETAAKSPRFALVKFFTRHAMLALAAYGMMVRLHLDPVGLLAGVSSLVIAVAVEVLRDLRWRRFP
jgi:hypothetical protein